MSRAAATPRLRAVAPRDDARHETRLAEKLKAGAVPVSTRKDEA